MFAFNMFSPGREGWTEWLQSLVQGARPVQPFPPPPMSPPAAPSAAPSAGWQHPLLDGMMQEQLQALVQQQIQQAQAEVHALQAKQAADQGSGTVPGSMPWQVPTQPPWNPVPQAPSPWDLRQGALAQQQSQQSQEQLQALVQQQIQQAQADVHAKKLQQIQIQQAKADELAQQQAKGWQQQQPSRWQPQQQPSRKPDVSGHSRCDSCKFHTYIPRSSFLYKRGEIAGCQREARFLTQQKHANICVFKKQNASCRHKCWRSTRQLTLWQACHLTALHNYVCHVAVVFVLTSD